jgi:hypothetical protein
MGIAGAQVGVMGLNAVSRQIVQNINIHLYVGGDFSILHQATATQWSPLAMFLIVFVLGVSVVAWMIAKVVKEAGQTTSTTY